MLSPIYNLNANSLLTSITVLKNFNSKTELRENNSGHEAV